MAHFLKDVLTQLNVLNAFRQAPRRLPNAASVPGSTSSCGSLPAPPLLAVGGLSSNSKFKSSRSICEPNFGSAGADLIIIFSTSSSCWYSYFAGLMRILLPPISSSLASFATSSIMTNSSEMSGLSTISNESGELSTTLLTLSGIPIKDEISSDSIRDKFPSSKCGCLVVVSDCAKVRNSNSDGDSLINFASLRTDFRPRLAASIDSCTSSSVWVTMSSINNYRYTQHLNCVGNEDIVDVAVVTAVVIDVCVVFVVVATVKCSSVKLILSSNDLPDIDSIVGDLITSRPLISSHVMATVLVKEYFRCGLFMLLSVGVRNVTSIVGGFSTAVVLEESCDRLTGSFLEVLFEAIVFKFVGHFSNPSGDDSLESSVSIDVGLKNTEWSGGKTSVIFKSINISGTCFLGDFFNSTGDESLESSLPSVKSAPGCSFSGDFFGSTGDESLESSLSSGFVLRMSESSGCNVSVIFGSNNNSGCASSVHVFGSTGDEILESSLSIEKSSPWSRCAASVSFGSISLSGRSFSGDFFGSTGDESLESRLSIVKSSPWSRCAASEISLALLVLKVVDQACQT
uniref:Uncharacterized protein n=1 Tax=Glossina austeni TaxID=7395 RepID=A0A1A9UJL5_GLOAU